MNEQQLRKYWLDFANRYCNQNFNKENLPPVVEIFIDGKIKEYRENPNVKSESLSDMNITYFDKELSREEVKLLGQVRKLKVAK
ncbi:MAG: hypothetical protein ACTTHM_04600 [Peptoanaerobacter stomatis]|uniref:hypothetical protein n=1 Tax=Peptoanaerobacter stomatis TaxID=796937 RepID=UPI003F9F3A85